MKERLLGGESSFNGPGESIGQKRSYSSSQSSSRRGGRVRPEDSLLRYFEVHIRGNVIVDGINSPLRQVKTAITFGNALGRNGDKNVLGGRGKQKED